VDAPLPLSEARVEPLAAFRAAVRAALERPPCLVSFSGGRDSSAAVAVAADVARGEGLPLPIPATALFLESAESDEFYWQEQVVRRLGLDEWLRVDEARQPGLLVIHPDRLVLELSSASASSMGRRRSSTSVSLSGRVPASRRARTSLAAFPLTTTP
jgi:hypothetical protein